MYCVGKAQTDGSVDKFLVTTWVNHASHVKGETHMPKEAATPAKEKQHGMHEVPTDLNRQGLVEITAALRQLLADAFALYLKTKNFHWHMTGQHFRDYHLLLDEHAEQIFGITDDIAERARKIGGTTLRSIGDISRHQRLKDNDNESVTPKEMLAELSADNQALTRYFRGAHETCEKYNDIATASLIEVWIDQTERRTWFLAEIVQGM
jgi:starvation-inducible DNA-binding protein